MKVIGALFALLLMVSCASSEATPPAVSPLDVATPTVEEGEALAPTATGSPTEAAAPTPTGSPAEEDDNQDSQRAQEALPTILEVQEGDNHAVIYWNSKTAVYDGAYDPYKQQGIYSYRIEWGEKGAGFSHSEVTPYRVFLAQPLEAGRVYEARVSHLDGYGNLSEPSEVVEFQHDPTRIEAQRVRLNGFFDDFNRSMGALDELKWNMAFSGCVEAGQGGHHINHELHAHTIAKSAGCDRAVVNARPREEFDFTDRTGTIEFDLDGSKGSRQLWYLDLYPSGERVTKGRPYEAGRKRDISGHVALDTDGGQPADPAHLLRFVQERSDGRSILIKFADADGYMRNLADFTDIYRNGACGNDLQFCEGENLLPVPNVRRHFRIEQSRTEVRMFVNDILVVDASLEPVHESGGLPYERASVAWLLFSYNTTKENISRSMLHWDNFGFDAPDTHQKHTVVHNYTDGRVGPDKPADNNDRWGGPKAKMDDPLLTTIPIPDQILDTAGVAPQAELMFTLQGNYKWPDQEQFIVLNEGTAHEKRYTLPQPTSHISGLPFERVVGPIVPYSVVLPMDVALPDSPSGLIQGDNLFKFYFDNVSVFNIHVELTYPVASEPPYTQPAEIFPDYATKKMPDIGPVGPGIVFNEIDGEPTWDRDLFIAEIDDHGHPVRFSKQNPVSGEVSLVISANTDAQLAAIGHATGISRYEILVNQEVISTIEVDKQSPVAYLKHEVEWDTTNLPNGTYELFVRAYDPDGNPSFFDLFQVNSTMGEYIPFEVTVNNDEAAIEMSGHVDLASHIHSQPRQ